jgi:hypothetical protein
MSITNSGKEILILNSRIQHSLQTVKRARSSLRGQEELCLRRKCWDPLNQYIVNINPAFKDKYRES